MARARVRPQPAPPDQPWGYFHRGSTEPRAVAWYGLREFWGHLFHFVASAIATEDIDSRDWMQPDRMNDLAAQIVRELGGTHYRGNLIDSLDRDLWFDYVADTGDSVDVSQAVARLLFAEYEVPDPDELSATLVLPRGDILLSGGDTAYPVATVDEINERVIVPFNRVLKHCRDGKRRVLLGIPGNHDWYDGLDGFGRLFRRREAATERAMRLQPTFYRRKTLNYYAEWAREFMLGGQMHKPKALLLDGYTPLQQASYFALPLSQALHLWGVDRQLRQVDFRQREFFASIRQRQPAHACLLLLPDPVVAFGEPTQSGLEMVRALGLDLDKEAHLLLAGDIHHYRRWRQGRSFHVTAGGGGAFLHPAPASSATIGADVAWPGIAQSRALLWQVPFRVATGRSGCLPHLAVLLGLFPEIAARALFGERSLAHVLCLAFALLASVTVCALIGNVGNRGIRAWTLVLVASLLITSAPALVARAASSLATVLGVPAKAWALAVLSGGVSVFLGAFVFGAYLAFLTRLGLQHTQAFTALAHPGFKHVLRIRLRRDGKTIDAWCLGLRDPLNQNEEPVLVDHFTWHC